jgi:hypothetical protein
VGTSGFDCSWESSTCVVIVVDLLAVLSASCVGFRLHLLCLQFLVDEGSVIVVLAVSTSAALSLRTGVRSCSTFLYTPYKALYSCFLSRSWWRFCVVSAIFWMIQSPSEAFAD